MALSNALGDNANLLASLLGLFTDQTSTQTTTSAPQTVSETGGGTVSSSSSSSGGYGYEQTILSQEAIDRLLAQILENGGSGLAATAQGQKTAGLYNSTTMQQMINDLMSRAAGEVAVRGAKTEKVTPISHSSSSSHPASNTVTRTTSGGTGTTVTSKAAPLGGNATKGLLGSFLANAALKKGASWIDKLLEGDSAGGVGEFATSFRSASPLSWDNLNANNSSFLTSAGEFNPLPSGELTPMAQAVVSGDFSTLPSSAFSVPEVPMFATAPSLSDAISMDMSMAMSDFDAADSILNLSSATEIPSALSLLDGSNLEEDALAILSSGYDGGEGFDFLNFSPDFSTSGADAAASLVDQLDIPSFDISGDTSAAIDALTSNVSSEVAGLADGFGAGDVMPIVSIAANLAEGDYIDAGAGAIGFMSGNPIAAIIANLPLIGEEVSDRVIEEVGDPIAENAIDAMDSVSNWFSSLDDGCFITTAVCEYKGLPDDCHELTVLRRFRDTWMQSSHTAEIAQYYKEAPHLVELLHALPSERRTELLESLWWQVSEAVRYIKSGYFNSAYQVYERMFVNLKLDLGVV